MANRRFIDFPIASSVGDSDIILIWQSGANKQTTKATFLSGLPENLDELNDVAISGLTNGQILRYDSVTGKWENTDQGNLDLNDLNDVSIVSPSNGQVLVYNSSTSKWENSSAGFVPYTGAVTTVNLGAQTIQAGSFVKAGGTAAQFLKANGSVDSNVYGTGTVTSVALTMPSAFTVGGSPITTAGTLAVTGAGNVGQYIRGDGSLADFPESSGGGSSVSYYLNGSVNQGTIGGVAYKEINKVPIIGTGTDFTIAADGYIASFITDAGDPNLLEIPAGNWNFETYFSASSSGGTPSFYVELYKVNSGGTATLIASNSGFPEFIAFGTIITSYFSTLAVPTTALALTDRLAIRYYVTHSGRTITLHTEDNHLCQIITTFTTGLTALNGLTAQVQNLAVGTSGTDFNIASATATHTFNLPTASATNRGALSSADWTTFNNKTSNLGTVTYVGLSSATSGVTIGSTPVTTSGTITLAIATASGSQNGLLSSTDWTTFNSKQNALTNPVTGTGTTNYLPKFTGASTIGNSQVIDNGTNVGIGVSPSSKLFINTGGVGATSNGIGMDNGAQQHFWYLSDNTTSTYQINSSGGVFRWVNSNGELIRIFSDGNTFIGTSPSNSGFKLDVNGTGRFSGSLRSNSHIIVSDGTASVVLQGYINNAIRIAASGSGSSGGSRGDLYAGFGDFGGSLTSQQTNISADGAGVVLQGYVDNTLRIAVRGSGYNSGSRGGLLASTGDFSSSVTAASFSNAGLQATEVINATKSNAGYFVAYFQNTSATGLGLNIQNGNDANDCLRISNAAGSANPIKLFGSGKAYFDGNVLIGTETDLSAKMYVKSGSSTQSISNVTNLILENNGSADDFYIFQTATVGGGKSFTISNSGKVLIGTSTSGSSKLRIVGLPTSSAGLSSGDVYNLSGVLMIA